MDFKQSKVQFSFLETATAGSTTTLVASSAQYQIFTGSANQTVVFPNATTLFKDIAFNIINVSTGIITVKLNDGTTTQATISAGSGAMIIVTDISTSNGVWDNKQGGASSAGGIGSSAPSATITSGSRGLFGGGSTGSDSSVIEYVTTSTLASSTSFGNLFLARRFAGACASSTRGVWGGGATGGTTAQIDYVSIASLNTTAQNFGNLTSSRADVCGFGSATRGIFAGGGDPGPSIIEFITIATTGNATSFGTLFQNRNDGGACASQTRGLIAGGADSGAGTLNNIEYVTIASASNGLNFGNLTQVMGDLSGCSNHVTGIFAGSDNGGAGSGESAVINQVTIATLANATSFGNLSQARSQCGACATPTIAITAGGTTGSVVGTMDYMVIATAANADNFGTLSVPRRALGGCSDSHGGI